MNRSRVLLIYTGGTIGMIKDPVTGHLRPFDFDNLTAQIPELGQISVEIKGISFEDPIDSSTVEPSHWLKMCQIIEAHYNNFDGFVILHGSDTMAYSASALSFMLRGLQKPVIFTGSQLPIGMIRTDGKENLITAVEIAGLKKAGKSVVREVAVYFEYKLYRGNRTHKFSADQFNAFSTPNYPVLAEAGVEINFNEEDLLRPTENEEFHIQAELDQNLAILHLFPGMQESYVSAILNITDLKAVIMLTYGSGNAPLEPWFLSLLENARKKDIQIVNVSQCWAGNVRQGLYETSVHLNEIGVIPGNDITAEAALAKTMFLLGQGLKGDAFSRKFKIPICGELSVENTGVNT